MATDARLGQYWPWQRLTPVVRSSRARLAWGLLLAGLGVVANLQELPVWLGIPLDPSLWTAASFLAGSLPAILGLLFLGGWWGVVIAALAWLPTLVIWGHPWGWIVMTAQFVWLSSFLVARGEQDLAIGTGRIIYCDLLFWLCLGSPATLLYQHYVNGFLWANAVVIAIKYPVNELLVVAIGYLVYVAIRIGRGERRRVGLSVRGLVLATVLVAIALPSFVFMLVSIQQLERAMATGIQQKFELLATGLAAYSEADLDDWGQADQVALGNADFYRLDASGRSWSSDPDLFALLDHQDRLVKTSFISFPGMRLLTPASERIRNKRWEEGYLVYDYRPSAGGSTQSFDGTIKLIRVTEPTRQLVLQAQRRGRGMLLVLAGMLSVAVVVSDYCARRFSREFEIVLVPISEAGKPLNLSDGDVQDSMADLPSLHASPIMELDAMVEVLNSRIHLVNQLTSDLRSTNQELEASRNRVQSLLALADQQMQTARQIQRSFLVEDWPGCGDCDLAYFLKSSYEVGADWYDVLRLGDYLFLVVADVCDKGVGSALFMSVFRSLLRYTLITEFSAEQSSGLRLDAPVEDRLSRAVGIVNQYMAQNHGGSSMFATVFLACFEPSSGAMTYVCAGHESPMIVRPSGLQALDVTGPAIGIFANASFSSQRTQLQPGDVMVAYTDGLTDARSPGQKSWGSGGLRGMLLELQGQGLEASAWVKAMTERVYAHIGTEDQFDDLTLMVLRAL
jgi:serine phosphatase RsbU (regulator of sigma subunit)